MIDLDEIVERLKAVPLRQGRRIIAIAGAPASGKSTLADQLAKRIANSCVVPMDGFHRSNEDLIAHDLIARKGAPQTFDVTGFLVTLKSLRALSAPHFPTFDRANDCVVMDGGQVASTDETILVEGNYLLLGSPPWDRLSELCDFSVFLRVPVEVLQQRLVQRWLDHGLGHSAALARAEHNDLPNARVVTENSAAADLVVTVG